MFFTAWRKGLGKLAQSASRRRKPAPRLRARPRLEALEDRCLPSTFAVLNTLDSGTGSLRQAILDANASPGADVIQFSIGGGGVQTIAPTSILPQITDPVTIDGTTQPGFAGSPLIELNGASANAWYGLFITAGNSTVRGLVINRFNGYGILLANNGNDTITGNYIGADVTGAVPLGNAGQGVLITGGSSGNTIGGADTNVPGTPLAGAGNLISSNGQFNTFTGGIQINGTGASNNLVEGNYVGTDVTGEHALGNGLNGISIDTGSAGNTIGGLTAGTGNVLSGNGYAGISLYSSGTGNLVEGNIIGLDAAGTAKLGNASHGLIIQQGSAGNTVGGTAAGAGNVISGNGNAGVYLGGTGTTGNVIEGNRIGTDVTGTAPLGNVGHGVFFDHVSGNTVGGADTNVPGAPLAGAGNLISDNGQTSISQFFGTRGVALSGGTGNVVQGNYIGTDITGAVPLANGYDGVTISDGASGNTIGGAAAGTGNLLSGNPFAGLELYGSGSGNLVEGNTIGLNATGTAMLGNYFGVVIQQGSAGNTIGGAGAGNFIADNTGGGVIVLHAGSTGNRVQRNSIYGNGGLGIDLNGDGVTPNDPGDADSGPNNLQNFPVISDAHIDVSGNLTVTYTVDSDPTNSAYPLTIEFYKADASGQGKTYLGTDTYTASDHAAGAKTLLLGNAAGLGYASGDVVVATATDAAGNTSEFTFTPVASLSGTVFVDFNNDGQIDFGEKGIAGVAIALSGTDYLGQAVSLSQVTDADGTYAFLNLRPGSYQITETQPAGYLQGIDSVGTAGGSLVATDQFFVQLAAVVDGPVGVNGLNYNFGERPPADGSVQQGQTATIGFWNNKNGQALILALNGGTGTQLADWLAATLPNTFGVHAGSNNLTGRTNAYVAAVFQQDFLLKGVKLDAQVLATALAVYVTNATLDSTQAAAPYGFTVRACGKINDFAAVWHGVSWCLRETAAGGLPHGSTDFAR